MESPTSIPSPSNPFLTPAPRTILHVDMDAFFASVEQRDHPNLRGQPVLVGHDGPRGVVAAASYEARVFGCHSAQPMAVAKRLCPRAIVVPVHMNRYREVSERVFEIFESFTPVVEPLSVDEAFLDLTGAEALHGPGRIVAQKIRTAVKTHTGLNASVGVAPNKFLAKLASDACKPDNFFVVEPHAVLNWLAPMPVGRLWGIGPKSAEQLAGVGIRTIENLRHMPAEWFDARFGSDAQRIQQLIRGLDDRPVTPDRDAKSIGHEETFSHNIADRDHLLSTLLTQVEQIGRRLRRHALLARGITVKIRFGDFVTITRSTTLAEPADTTDPLYAAARAAFNAWAEKSFQPVRLIGASAKSLAPANPQLPLFEDPARAQQKKLDGVMDAIQSKFGKSAIGRGHAGPNDPAETKGSKLRRD